MAKILRISFLLTVTTVLSFCSVKWQTTGDFIESRPLISSFEEIVPDSMYDKAWLVWVKQPLDHHAPEKGFFEQRVWLSHKSSNAPMVMVTEGYMAPANYTSELARLINANQLVVEHRYFGGSVPDSMDWQFLTVEQAAMDHHRIVEAFKDFYKGKWINTGISKGGQTAMIHRALYPKDVDVSVPYVAPFNLEREDQRLVTFFDSVGTASQRERIRAFQEEVLKRKEEMMPYFYDLAEQKGYTFRMGEERAFELAVLEYPFSLWQWCGPVDEIPESGSDAEILFSHLHQGSDFGYFSDQQWEDIGPFFYQAYKELGYYPYLAAPLKEWMDEVKEDTVSNRFMAPQTENLIFDENIPFEILRKLKKADPEMIVITGENDPWSATSLIPDGFNNVLKIEKPGGCHRTRINNLPDSLRVKVINQLELWLN
jgi:hypothetical protein